MKKNETYKIIRKHNMLTTFVNVKKGEYTVKNPMVFDTTGQNVYEIKIIERTHQKLICIT